MTSIRTENKNYLTWYPWLPRTWPQLTLLVIFLRFRPYLQPSWLIMTIPTWHLCSPIPRTVLLASPIRLLRKVGVLQSPTHNDEASPEHQVQRDFPAVSQTGTGETVPNLYGSSQMHCFSSRWKSWKAETTSCQHCTHPIPTVHSAPTPSPGSVSLTYSTQKHSPWNMPPKRTSCYYLIYHFLHVTTTNMFSLEHSSASCPDIIFQ